MRITASLQNKNNMYYVVVGYYTPDGKRKQKWVPTNLDTKNNKRKAEQMMEQIKSNFETEIRDKNPTFCKVIAEWLQVQRDSIAKSTYEGYETYAKRHIIPFFERENKKISDIRPADISEYYHEKFKSGRLDGKEGGLSIKTLKTHRVVIVEVLKYAMMKGYIQTNPASGVKMPAKHDTHVERIFLTGSEVRNVINAFDGNALQPIVTLALYYGLRKSEVLGIKWKAVDFENHKLIINHTVVKNKTIEAKDSTKTEGSAAVFPLIEEPEKMLRSLRSKRRDELAEVGKQLDEDSYVFCRDEDGQTPLRPDSLTKSFERVLKKSGLTKMRFHDLRHSTASFLYDEGWNMKDTQMWLRHSTIETTADIYTHISKSRTEALAKNVGTAFAKY